MRVLRSASPISGCENASRQFASDHSSGLPHLGEVEAVDEDEEDRAEDVETEDDDQRRDDERAAGGKPEA